MTEDDPLRPPFALSDVDPDPPGVPTGAERDGEGARPGIALCLSGGGYRAMLFHLGALWRLNELGVLRQLARVSSVSGGSITAALVGAHWRRLDFDGAGVSRAFRAQVVAPVRGLASTTIDVGAVVGGLLLPGNASDRVVAAYRDHLFGDATLQDLPDDDEGPRFVINASNVQSGALWRFMKPYMRDYRVGEVRKPRVPLAVAVAASSAFPPFLSPVELDLETAEYTPRTGDGLQRAPFTTRVVLTDGGVYDNLGLETCWKRYQTILVSDAGGTLSREASPHRDWLRHAYRVLNLVDNQVRALRKRQLIYAYERGDRRGAYWGIRSDVAHYAVPDPLPTPRDKTLALAGIATRLKALPSEQQERLINWGYAVCDAAMRKHVEKGATRGTFPYAGGVG